MARSRPSSASSSCSASSADSFSSAVELQDLRQASGSATSNRPGPVSSRLSSRPSSRSSGTSGQASSANSGETTKAKHGSRITKWTLKWCGPPVAFLLVIAGLITLWPSIRGISLAQQANDYSEQQLAASQWSNLITYKQACDTIGSRDEVTPWVHTILDEVGNCSVPPPPDLILVKRSLDFNFVEQGLCRINEGSDWHGDILRVEWMLGLEVILGLITIILTKWDPKDLAEFCRRLLLAGCVVVLFLAKRHEVDRSEDVHDGFSEELFWFLVFDFGVHLICQVLLWWGNSPAEEHACGYMKWHARDSLAATSTIV